MKNLFFIFFVFTCTIICQGQGSILSSTIGSNGTSKIINSNNESYYVSQSIDQTSVIGTFTKNGYTIRQGFQQPKYNIGSSNNFNLNATVYPNPFNHSVNISFTDTITDSINITITDMSGRTLKSIKHKASQKIELHLEYLSSGIYILKVTTKNKQLITNLLKN
ncbi:Por secretion system C-terminal sorting domain-containing protein [Lutibacter oricola]|uniref:Por secretion system C-terminal sorting domain-containing protein n=1 Tax=Lutibacter oricola TaxID=762486 RepID=A0A1H2WXG6_9FLAO|nr:T9SS type A sorting domain-containing protein [Lutibacter oricola]SDW85206.1 Por secretion system C-terminal sorting domain-containing protein [Lutibacter oricola]